MLGNGERKREDDMQQRTCSAQATCSTRAQRVCQCFSLFYTFVNSLSLGFGLLDDLKKKHLRMSPLTSGNSSFLNILQIK